MRSLFLVIFILTIHHETNSCMFKKRDGPDADNYWDSMSFERQQHSSKCECGKPIDFSVPLPWNVEVRTTSPDGSVKSCSGTIVASNLIVTSHQCIELKGQKMRIYDLFNFKHGEQHLAGKDKITVISSKDAAKTFTVVNVFPNPQYATSSQKKIYPENDVVIIRVEADFITESDFTPICLPFYESKFDQSDIQDQPGTYYGEGESGKPGVMVTFNGDVVKKSVCYDEINVHDKKEFQQKSGNRTLCLKFSGGKTNPPIVEGGPLIVKVGDKNAFLVGIADSVKDADKMEARSGLAGSIGEDYTYFSGINPVVKFIEFFAQKEKSTWCKTPDGEVLNLKPGKKGGAETTIRRQKPWPWDSMGDTKRDESLNCLCGIQNTKIMGRVVGGVEATPREFGWMTVINLYINGKHSGASLCGGSVINDRMILTAAHCVVNERTLEKDPQKDPTIAPENVVVTLNAHMQKNDPEAFKKEVAAVLFHPGYLDGRQAKPEYYDSDVALLVLKDRLEFPTNEQKGVRPICLPTRGEYMEIVGKNAWVVGWGLTDPKNRRSTASKLQKLDIPIAELKYCSNVATSKVTENNICAGTLNMYKDAASGDSGGPLQIEDTSTSRWFEVGLVSWGEDVEQNGDTQTAALYADVQKLMPFIDYHALRIQAKWCKQKE